MKNFSQSQCSKDHGSWQANSVALSTAPAPGVGLHGLEAAEKHTTAVPAAADRGVDRSAADMIYKRGVGVDQILVVAVAVFVVVAPLVVADQCGEREGGGSDAAVCTRVVAVAARYVAVVGCFGAVHCLG